MKTNKLFKGHLFALFTAIVWGTTFISTKVLLTEFHPVEILFIRFVLGFIALFIIYPHIFKIKSLKEELTFALAGLCGVTLYFLFENIALTYTRASNVGIIVSIAPLCTALLSRFFARDEKLTPGFFVGLFCALLGVSLISLNGSRLDLNPIGDLLALGAAVVWSFYSIIIKKISGYGYHIIQTTRRIFLYGLIFMIPVIPFFDVDFEPTKLKNPLLISNFLFLGLIASALGYVTWNYALKTLGAVKASVYIYVIPVVTVITSILVLGETITIISAVGTALTLLGLVLSERKGH